MAHQRITDGRVSVGLSKQWTSFQFRFHNFAALSTTRTHYIASPEFTCNAHPWQLRVYPGGDNQAEEGMVSVYLHHLSKGSITVNFRISVMDKFGEAKKDFRSSCKEFSSKTGNGWKDFISRSDIVDESKNILDSNGALTIIVSMTEVEPSTMFVPQNPFFGMMKEMFNDETTADACFEVVSCTDEEEGEGESKTSVPFHAHRSILRKCAPMLADLLGSDDTASITDIKPEIFHHTLYYVYGGEVPEDELKAHAKEIIDAADKYSIVNLKLTAEVKYVEFNDITFDNAIDDLLYADAKNCALLKEKVMQFLADNHHDAAEKISFTHFPGHVVKDLFIALGRNSKKHSTDNNADELTTLCVDVLRRKLDELGLEVDGSREAMIESIKSQALRLERKGNS